MLVASESFESLSRSLGIHSRTYPGVHAYLSATPSLWLGATSLLSRRTVLTSVSLGAAIATVALIVRSTRQRWFTPTGRASAEILFTSVAEAAALSSQLSEQLAQLREMNLLAALPARSAETNAGAPPALAICLPPIACPPPPPPPPPPPGLALARPPLAQHPPSQRPTAIPSEDGAPRYVGAQVRQGSTSSASRNSHSREDETVGAGRQADGAAGMGMAGALAQIRSGAVKLRHVGSPAQVDEAAPARRGAAGGEAESIVVVLKRTMQERKAAMDGASSRAVASDSDEVEDAEDWET